MACLHVPGLLLLLLLLLLRTPSLLLLRAPPFLSSTAWPLLLRASSISVPHGGGELHAAAPVPGCVLLAA
jgi:hypothetical protein